MPVTNQSFLPTVLTGAHSLHSTSPLLELCWNLWCSERADLGQKTLGERDLGGSFHPDNFPGVVKGLERGCSRGERVYPRNSLLLKVRRSGQSGVILALDQVTEVVLHCASPKKVQWPTLGRNELVERRLCLVMRSMCFYQTGKTQGSFLPFLPLPDLELQTLLH